MTSGVAAGYSGNYHLDIVPCGQAGVEVNPEMIEAAVDALLSYYSDELQDRAEDVVLDVFRAMAAASTR